MQSSLTCLDTSSFEHEFVIKKSNESMLVEVSYSELESFKFNNSKIFLPSGFDQRSMTNHHDQEMYSGNKAKIIENSLLVDYEHFQFDLLETNEEFLQPKAPKGLEEAEEKVMGNYLSPMIIKYTKHELEPF